MRVLFVLHGFLPKHPAGSEIHTWQLAARLRERGHEVHVFCAEKDISRPDGRLVRREWDGIPVHELTNNLFYRDLAETWDWPPAEEAFRRLLDELRPDVVHVMHLLYLSVGCVEEAARRGIPIVYTLHDYWLQCPRFGQRIHPDGSICHEIDFERCGGCLATFKFNQAPLERRMARVIAGVRSVTGLDLGGLARRTIERARLGARPKGVAATPPGPSAIPSPGPPPVPEAQARPFAELAARRDRELRERIVPRVHRFIAPSRFLNERFLEWGVPAEKIVQLAYGLELEPFRDFQRVPSETIRVGYVGTLAPHKAPDLLLEAWLALPAELRAAGRLTIHGPRQFHPEYVARLVDLAARSGAALAGGVRREEIATALAEIDLLVVPSIWYENSPLTILEALATRTPVLVSDLGGMAELVEPGVTGWRFRVGDVADLTRHLERVLADRAVLASLPMRKDAVEPMERTAERVEALYLGAGGS